MRHRNDKWEREMEHESEDWDTQLKKKKKSAIGEQMGYLEVSCMCQVCVHNYIWVSKDHSHTTGYICVHAFLCVCVCVCVCVRACVCALCVCVRVSLGVRTCFLRVLL